jgi:signal transduction histidine kinase/predicted hydrocarbon binding protein
MELSIINYLSKGWLEVGSTRMILLEVRGGFYALRDSLEMLVGPDVAERVLYEAGNAGGMSYASSAVAAGTVPAGIDGFAECVRVYSEAGFGDFAVEALDPDAPYAFVSCRHSFESWAYREHGRFTSRHVCDYSAGVLAGFMRCLTGLHGLECAELQCTVHGADKCLFEVKPVSGPSQRYRPLELWQSAMLARENARLLEEAERRSEQLLRQNSNLSMLVELASTVNQPLDLHGVLSLGLETVAKHYGADAALVSLVDAGRARLVLSAQRGIPTSVGEALTSLPLGSHPFGVSIKDPDRVSLLDLSGEVRQPAPALAAAGFRVAIVVALPYRGRLVGIMVLLWKRPSKLSDDDVSILAAVGKQMGVALENQRLVQSSAELATAKERNRIARELHDSVNQTLFAMVLTLNSMLEKANADPQYCAQAETIGALRELRDMASKALVEMRNMMSQLRPAKLEGERLGSALSKYAEWLRSQTGISVDVVFSGMVANEELDTETEDGLFRIAQEAVSNAVKHSGATRIVIALSRLERSLKLEVRDNGRGFVPRESGEGGGSGTGLGLVNMKERARTLGGRLCIRSKLGRGTVVGVEVPLSSSPYIGLQGL